MNGARARRVGRLSYAFISTDLAQQVTCPPLPAPANGKVTACQVSINDVCSFDCDNGYILSPSNQQRKCQPDGSWTGSDVTCLPCGQNTYKAGPGQCTRCPADTHTTGTASMLVGCICNDGLTGPGGGPCQDVNECSRQNGGCEQSCENTRGGFQCKCSIPGYKVNPADRKRCIVEKQCSSFTTPTNGGIVCHHKNDTNTDRCQVKCNDGFEHPVRSNQFEECGPATNFKWSYEINNIPIPACVEQYFPGVIVDAEIAYFVASCDQLTDQQKQDAKNAFLQLLRGQGVCLENGRAVCNVTDLWIECGEIDLSGGIQKRDASSSRVLKFKFKLTTDQKPVRTMNCGRFCDGQAVCDACFTNHVQSTVRKVTAEQEKLREVFGTQAAPDARPNPQPRPGVSTTSGAGVAPKSFNRGITAFRSNLARNFNRVIPSTSGQSPVRPTEAVTTAAPPRGMMNIGGLVLMPAPTGLQMMSDVKMACETGMEKKRDMCVPCTPGSNLPPGGSRCEQCIAGMYQPEAQKTSCIPCPAGKTSPRGAIGCA
ncbi:signal peptide, CUB and EGF-like domain-containing protein 1 [Lingula anatina]|uniref:Signal peptide, CUB and EGF-like domain-containing protein 1 n=1 Tax=Lingula anatina TaxID=7574 RepID=A0A1S3IVZ2_LINAN|nr:signal peptide, CUB and EGF-like domain-containing protein 1 [Lingula anatina]|eukprot:XP_013402131.1 signal peptide, CUB and EGF-like domain-containing protein 1 [Lingula anatina]